MPGFLRQSTASQSRALGPFIDDTDFKTPETGLTVANTDIKLVVNGAASVNKNSGGGTHRVNGVYGVTFDATDTATVGEMDVSIVVAGALPVFDKFTVIEEAVYDAFYAASALGYVVDPNTALIKAKTDNLPSDPADQSALQTLIEDVPTVAEFNARTLPTASYATATAQTTLQTSVDDIPTNAELASTIVLADVKKINGTTVNGNGSTTPWGP